MKNQDYQFCFDLSKDEKHQYFVPTCYVVQNQDAINYVNKKATKLVLDSYGINIEHLSKELQSLLTICENLKPETIFKKFHKKLKSQKSLLDLLEDKKIGYAIKDYIQSKLNLFLQTINQNQFQISIQLCKDKNFAKAVIQKNNPLLKAELIFEKTEMGMTYSLSLLEEDSMFYPSDKKIFIITNKPAWVVVDKKLFQIKDLDSKKIIPFITKKTIEIPSASINLYFEKFIKDIVKKVNIQAKGFDVVQKNKIINCSIAVDENFINKEYQIKLLFDYDGYTFENLSSKQTHTYIDNDKAGNIKVFRYQRSQESEVFFEKQLKQFGFKKNDFGWFELKNNPTCNPYQTIDFLIENRQKILNEGFFINEISVSKQKIQTEIATINCNSQENQDWFDLKMTIKCGDIEINFSEIITNIKENNRFFKLPNGNVFLIPIEWMTRYSTLVTFAKVKNEDLILAKSNFTILENLNLDNNLASYPTINYEPSNLLKANLRPYQIEGVNWMLKNHSKGLGTCLADDMGLGKTLQTLATLVTVYEKMEAEPTNGQADLFTALDSKKEALNALIVLPSSLIFNWYNEAKKFAPHFTKLRYTGADRKQFLNKLDRYDLIFTSYNIITRDIAAFKKYQFRYLILDESQQIKNRDSKIFKSINSIYATHKISLSGTPIENSLSDLWSQMEFINPDILGSYPFFNKHFKIAIEKNKDQKAINELKKIVNPFILRRTKQQVLKDLPEITEQIVYCEMNELQEKKYETEKSKARNELLKIENSNNKIYVLNVLLKLRQWSNHPKLVDQHSEIASGKFQEVTNYIETLLKTENKMLIFSNFTSHLALYEKWCTENKITFCKLTGITKNAERENQVNRFQNDDTIKVFFLSIGAGNVGINLTKASYVLFLDPWWNPFKEEQAKSRAHRIGQENKVNVVRFISKNSIEEKIILLQEQKKIVSESIIEAGDLPTDLDKNLHFILT